MASQIIVPLDGSALAETVLPSAVALARATCSTLTLLRVITPLEINQAHLWVSCAPATLRMQWESNAAARTHAYLAHVAERLPKNELSIQTEILWAYDIAGAIVARAQQDPDTHIAMVTHGRTGVRRWLLGSVAQTVIAKATTPILVVHTRDDQITILNNAPYRTIVVPLDDSTYTEEALIKARNLAIAVGAVLVLIAVVPAVDDHGLDKPRVEPFWRRAKAQTEINLTCLYLQHIADQLAAHGLTVRTKFVTGAPTKAILHSCTKEHADLLVMADHRHSDIDHILGSVVEQVLHEANIPLLLIPAQTQPAHDAQEERSAVIANR